MARFRFLMLVLAVLLILTACGGPSGSTTQPTAATSGEAAG